MMTLNDLPAILEQAWPLLLGTLVLGLVVGFGLHALIAMRRHAALEQALAVTQTRLEADQLRHQEKLEAYDEAGERMAYRFQQLAGSALNSNSDRFLDLAREQMGRLQQEARGDLDQRRAAVDQLIAPIQEALKRTGDELNKLESQRREAQGALNEHLTGLTRDQQSLREETTRLVQALRRPEVRGRWGEMSLRRLVELAGMSEHCDFTEQTTVDGPEGRLRPDMLIHLPDERDIVVDVKTPLDAYLDATEAKDDQARAAALARHARHVRQRVKELSAKAYWQQFRHSPDFVVLFIPGEPFLSAAAEADPKLIEQALAERIILATPTSFIAILRAIAWSWRQLAIVRNAERIRETGETFQHRLAVFSEHLAVLGKHLDASVRDYNKAIGSLERQVMPGVRRFQEMGIQAAREMAEPNSIDTRTREPQINDPATADTPPKA